MSSLLLKDNRPTAIDKYPVRFGTGSSFVVRGYSDRFLNSAIYRDDSTVTVLQENKQDDDLIKLRERFNSELVKLQGVSQALAEKRFNNSVSFLSLIDSDNLTVEVTNDESLYFSLVKEDYKIYLEEYVDDGEVIVTMFKGGIKQKSISGDIRYVASRLQEVTSY